jgi:hypothetical protein
VTAPTRKLVCGGGRLGAAQEAAHAGDELADAEGLGHVVVGAGVDAGDDVGLGAAGGQHEHGGEVAAGAQALEEGQAVDAGEHPVEEDEVVAAGGELDLGLVAVGGELEVEALGAQELDQAVADRGLVLDDQVLSRRSRRQGGRSRATSAARSCAGRCAPATMSAATTRAATARRCRPRCDREVGIDGAQVPYKYAYMTCDEDDECLVHGLQSVRALGRSGAGVLHGPVHQRRGPTASATRSTSSAPRCRARA